MWILRAGGEDEEIVILYRIHEVYPRKQIEAKNDGQIVIKVRQEVHSQV